MVLRGRNAFDGFPPRARRSPRNTAPFSNVATDKYAPEPQHKPQKRASYLRARPAPAFLKQHCRIIIAGPSLSGGAVAGQEKNSPMDFWKIYRLVRSRRWLIVGIMLMAAAVIYVGASLQGQKKSYQAISYLQLAERNLPPLPGGTTVGPDPRNGIERNVSSVVMQLRTPGQIHYKAADLLRLPERERAVEVERILTANGTFGQIETQARAAAKTLVKNGAISPEKENAQADAFIAQRKRAFVDAIARGRDEAGTWGENGVPGLPDALVERIRGTVTYDAIGGPLKNEANPDIVPMVQVQSISPRAAEASLFTNMVCIAYVDVAMQQNKAGYYAQSEELKRRRKEAKEASEKARARLQTFLSQPAVIALGPEKPTAEVNMDRYDNQRAQFQAEVAAVQATLDSVKALQAAEVRRAPGSGGLVETTPFPTDENPLVRSLKARVADLELDFARENERSGPVHDEWQVAHRLLLAARNELERAKKQPFTSSTPSEVARSLRTQFSTSQTRLAEAQTRLASAEGDLKREQARVAKLPAVQFKLYDLKSEAKRTQDAFNAYDAQLRTYDLHQIDQNTAGLVNIAGAAAIAPLGTSRSPVTLATYGLVLALVFSVALVVAMDALDNSVRSTLDVEKLLGLPVAGVIPAQLPDPNRAPRITYLDPLSPVAEAYRLLRTDLLFTAEEHPFKSLMTATGKPGQGSTTTICNLAIALAQAGKRVILVDADLRRPRLHSIFGTTNDAGLTSLLQDEAELEEALKATEVDNLLLLPSGPLPLNPSELLQSPKMRAVHERLKSHTDYVLFDSPSAVAFSDASVLASFVDAVLLVVRANNVPRGSELLVKQMLTRARANILGVVLNGVSPDHVDSVHYHYHYYPVLASRVPAGALNGTNGSNGHKSNGSGAGSGAGNFEIPLALPGDEAPSGGTPFSAGGAARTSGSGATLEATQTMRAATGGGAVADSSGYAAGSPFVEQRSHSSGRALLRRLKAAVPFIVLALVVALIVLAISSSVTPTP